MKTILHIDINSYFATMLQQENPHLRGKPVGVTKSEGRNCLIAVSKEAKKYGVKTGCRLKDALPLCPDIICLPAQFDRYLDATHRLKKVFHDISPDVRIYSLDEAFVDISSCLRYLYSDPVDVAQKVQANIKKELGEWVTCNVGISYNHLLCKMASNSAPKGEIMTVTPENKDLLLASVGFEDVCGIGFRLGKKLAQMGVTNPYQIRFYSEQDLLPVFGPFWAKELLRIGYGEDSHNLTLLNRELPHMKSVGRSITGYRLHDSEEEIKAVLLNLMEEVTHKVRRMNLSGRYVSIYLNGHDQHWHAHRTLQYYVRHTKELFDILYNELYLNWKRRFKVIKFGVRLGMLAPISEIPRPIFPSWHKQEKLSEALDAITEKYGLFMVRPASIPKENIIKPEVTGFLGDRQYYGL